MRNTILSSFINSNLRLFGENKTADEKKRFLILSSLHHHLVVSQPLIQLQSSRRLHFFALICGAFKRYFFFRLNLVKLTRGVYRTHTLKFRAFCRLLLSGTRRKHGRYTRTKSFFQEHVTWLRFGGFSTTDQHFFIGDASTALPHVTS